MGQILVRCVHGKGVDIPSGSELYSDIVEREKEISINVSRKRSNSCYSER